MENVIKTDCFLALFLLVDARESTENRLGLCFNFLFNAFLFTWKKTERYHILNYVTNILIIETCVINKRERQALEWESNHAHGTYGVASAVI